MNFMKKVHRYILFFVQLVAHLSIIPMVIYGEPYHYIVSFFVYFLTGCLGMTMTYHRLLAHKSWKSPKWFEYIGALLGTIGLTGSTIGWVAIHREHHRYSDKEKDPHSPIYKGFWKVQYLSMFEKPVVKYVIDLARSKFHTKVHKFYWLINIVYGIILFFIDPFAIVYAYLFPAMILWNAGSFVNTINHLFGYRSHNTDDSSVNNLFLGYFVWGEGWHNNHHANQHDPKFGKKWWELDIGYLFIKLLNTNRIQTDNYEKS